MWKKDYNIVMFHAERFKNSITKAVEISTTPLNVNSSLDPNPIPTSDVIEINKLEFPERIFVTLYRRLGFRGLEPFLQENQPVQITPKTATNKTL